MLRVPQLSKFEREDIMTTEWPVVRQGWTGHRPQIFGNHSTADIFRLACRPGGATIKEMLRLRRDTGNDDDKKEAALKKLIKEIEKAYLVELIVNGDNYRFQRVNSNVSSPNKTPQQIYNQPQDNSYLLSQGEIPTLDEIKAIYKENVKLGEDIDPDRLKILIKQLRQ